MITVKLTFLYSISQELVSWLQKYVQDILDLQKDLRNGLALLAVVESITGVKYPHCAVPKSYEECHRNCTIALMAIFRLYENLQVDITAEGRLSFLFY